MILMTVDHVGFIFDLHSIYRIVGRLSFPLFAFLIYQGFLHSSDIFKYLRRLLLFGLSIELLLTVVNFYVTINNIPRNIFLTLSFGLIGLLMLNSNKSVLEKMFIVFLLSFIAETLNFDYGWYGVILVISFYFLKTNVLITIIIQLTINFIYYYFLKFDIQFYALFSWGFILLYNGQIGTKLKHNKLMYFYYPLHLTLLFLIKIYIFK